MGELKIGAWVFIDFGVNLWKDPEKAKSLAQWKIFYHKSNAAKEAERLGMQGSSIMDTSYDGTKRMLAVLESELEGIPSWDAYIRNYVDTITEPVKISIMSGCMCGALSGGKGCGCGDGCECGSSEDIETDVQGG